MTLDEIKALNAYELASMAHVHSPDTSASAGAVLLNDVRDWYLSAVNDGRADDDDERWLVGTIDANEGGALPHQTYALWSAFTDLRAWEEDLTETGLESLPADKITDLPEIMLGIIARRLVDALHAEVADTEDTE